MQDLLNQLESKQCPIAIVGLGYVGLPLAAKLATQFKVVGFDIDARRVAALQRFEDATGEVSSEVLKACELQVTTDPEVLAASRLIIVTVPTPITSGKQPDLTPLESSSRTIGKYLKPGSVVVYESTVYPGVTEDYCGPILAAESGLTCGEDFFLGYSPERINPGDQVHTVDKIVKVVSGQTPEVRDLLAEVYGRIVTAGIHLTPDIRTAEAAKVIENTQRDLNIAFVNELALIFQHLGLRTSEVLKAAGTKWNFLKFSPGLVGGHCIGVDPYYLIHKAQQVGYEPQIIQAGRKINDQMGRFVGNQTIKQMIQAGNHVVGAKVLVLGLTFKENIPDTRNSKVIDILDELEDYGVSVFTHDPHAEYASKERGTRLTDLDGAGPFSAIVLAVPHREYLGLGLAALRQMGGEKPVLVDVKAIFEPQDAVAAGFRYWSL